MPLWNGPALGAKLAQLESLWLASDLRLSRHELLA
jgi:poly(A) polymerase